MPSPASGSECPARACRKESPLRTRLAAASVAALLVASAGACVPAAPRSDATPSAGPTQHASATAVARSSEPPRASEPARATGSASPSRGPSTTDATARPSPSATPRVAPDQLACAISASGGLEDKHSNANVYRGMDRANRERAVAIDFLESTKPADYGTNIERLLGGGCDMVIAVGEPLGYAVDIAAVAHPDRRFVIVDPIWPSSHPNVLSITFRAEEAAMLAGYLAAGMTKTGTIGTYGGVQTPATTAVMDGLVAGVRYYNRRNGTSVEVVGWYPGRRDRGLFVGDVVDRAAGRRLALQLLAQGADVIVPVAGGASLGGAAAIQDAGALLIGVETDQYETSVEFGDVTLTSILKRADTAVYDAIVDAVDGTFTGGVYEGDLANGGVDLAPFHVLEGTVPSRLQREIDELRARIATGQVNVHDHVE